MCDQANHDNCEIIDALHLTITNLEMTIADLKAEIVEDLKRASGSINPKNNLWHFIASYKADNLIKKWEAK